MCGSLLVRTKEACLVLFFFVTLSCLFVLRPQLMFRLQKHHACFAFLSDPKRVNLQRLVLEDLSRRIDVMVFFCVCVGGVMWFGLALAWAQTLKGVWIFLFN